MTLLGLLEISGRLTTDPGFHPFHIRMIFRKFAKYRLKMNWAISVPIRLPSQQACLSLVRRDLCAERNASCNALLIGEQVSLVASRPGDWVHLGETRVPGRVSLNMSPEVETWRRL